MTDDLTDTSTLAGVYWNRIGDYLRTICSRLNLMEAELEETRGEGDELEFKRKRDRQECIEQSRDSVRRLEDCLVEALRELGKAQSDRTKAESEKLGFAEALKQMREARQGEKEPPEQAQADPSTTIDELAVRVKRLEEDKAVSEEKAIVGSDERLAHRVRKLEEAVWSAPTNAPPEEDDESDKASTELRERLAESCHRLWCEWMDRLFSTCCPAEPSTNGLRVFYVNANGDLTDESHAVPSDECSYVISHSTAAQWKNRMRRSYSELTEEEKDTDRKGADKILNCTSPFVPGMAWGEIADLIAQLRMDKNDAVIRSDQTKRAHQQVLEKYRKLERSLADVREDYKSEISALVEEKKQIMRERDEAYESVRLCQREVTDEYDASPEPGWTSNRRLHFWVNQYPDGQYGRLFTNPIAADAGERDKRIRRVHLVELRAGEEIEREEYAD